MGIPDMLAFLQERFSGSTEAHQGGASASEDADSADNGVDELLNMAAEEDMHYACAEEEDDDDDEEDGGDDSDDGGQDAEHPPSPQRTEAEHTGTVAPHTHPLDSKDPFVARLFCVDAVLGIACVTHIRNVEMHFLKLNMDAAGMLYALGYIAAAPQNPSDDALFYDTHTNTLRCRVNTMTYEELGKRRSGVARALARLASENAFQPSSAVYEYGGVFLGTLRMCMWAEAVCNLALTPPPCTGIRGRMTHRFKRSVVAAYQGAESQLSGEALRRRASMSAFIAAPLLLPWSNFIAEAKLTHYHGPRLAQAFLQHLTFYAAYSGKMECVADSAVEADETKRIPDAERDNATFAQQVACAVCILKTFIQRGIAVVDDLHLCSYPERYISRNISSHAYAAHNPNTTYLVCIHSYEAYVIHRRCNTAHRRVIGPFTDPWHFMAYIMTQENITVSSMLSDLRTRIGAEGSDDEDDDCADDDVSTV